MQRNASANESFNADNLELVQKNEWQQKKYCQICYEKFTTIIRQHHCRMCGRSCCHSCSSKRAISTLAASQLGDSQIINPDMSVENEE